MANKNTASKSIMLHQGDPRETAGRKNETAPAPKIDFADPAKGFSPGSMSSVFPYDVESVMWCEKNDLVCYSAYAKPYWDDAKGRVSKGKEERDAEGKMIGFRTMPNKTYKGWGGKALFADPSKGWTMMMTRTGGETRLFVIDIDIRGSGDEAQTPADVVGEEVFERLTADCGFGVKTGSGGAHLYYRIPEGYTPWVKKMNLETFFDVDVKGQVDILCDGHGIILPGSYYKYQGNTFTYEPADPATTMDDIRDMPDWLIEWADANLDKVGAVRKHTKSAKAKKVEVSDEVVEHEAPADPVDEEALRYALTAPPPPQDKHRPRSVSPGIRGLTEELQLVAKFIGCIKAEFFKPYDNWIRFITCLKSISTMSACKSLCLKACRKPKKYDTDEAEASTRVKWDEIEPDGRMTMGTLRYWAKQSNPEEYLKVVKSSYRLMVLGNINQVAEVFASEVAGTLVYAGCAGKSDHKFFQYHEHLRLWAEVDESAVAYTMVEVMPLVCDRIREDILATSKAENAQDQAKLVFSIGNKIGQGMGSRYIPPLRVILNPAVAKSPFLKDKAFKLDERPELLPLENGVWNFKTGKLEMYDRSHYCSYRIPICYNPDADTTDIQTAFEMWFNGDKTKIDFLKYWLGYCLTGETSRDEFMIVYGSKGGNGKTLLFEEILGEDIFGNHLYQALAEDALMKKGGTNDSLFDAQGKRLLMLSEVGKATGRNKLNVEILKKWSGRGEIAARAVYERERRFKPMGKLVMLTNQLPELPADDGGIARRLIVLEQNIPFVKPDLYITYSEEMRNSGQVRKQDENFVKRLRQNKEGWVKWLVEGAMEFMADPKRKAPESILEYSETARTECDKYASWMKANLLMTRVPTDVIRFRSIADYFCKESGVSVQNTSVKEELKRRIIAQGVDTRGDAAKGRLEVMGVRWRVGCDPELDEAEQEAQVARYETWRLKNPSKPMVVFLSLDG